MWRFVLCLTASCCVYASIAAASAPPLVPVTQMIAQAKAIGAGQVLHVKPLAEGPPESIWRPNKLVTVQIDEAIRGALDPEIHVAIRSDPWEHPTLKVGDRILLFVADPEPARPNADPPTADIFAAAQGFVPVASVPAACRDALRASIGSYRPSSAPSFASRPRFNDDAVEPFIDLLDADDPRVRRWVVGNVLTHLHLTPDVEKHLVTVLDDANIDVRRSAAYTLARRRYGWRGKLAEWRAPEGDGVATKIERLLQADEILRGLYSDAADAPRIAEMLITRSKSNANSIPYAFHVSEGGEIAPASAPAHDANDPIARFVVDRLRHFDGSRMRRLPLTFRIDAWTADKAYLYVILLPNK